MTGFWNNPVEGRAVDRIDRKRHAVRAILRNFYHGHICPRVAKRQLAEKGIYGPQDIPRGWLADICT